MNWGRIAVGALVVAGIGFYGALRNAQEFMYYVSIDPEGPDAVITAESPSREQPLELPLADFQGIDKTSSPIGWRACFTLTQKLLPDMLTTYPDPTPLNAPRWFDCFDSGQITADLASGAARAVVGTTEIRTDVDRVLAIYPDGRVYGWHQLNDKTPERGVMD